VTSPVCSPSRTALITSLYPTTLGSHHHKSQTKDKDDGGNGKLTRLQRVIFNKPRPPEELYDIETDPFETQNLADDPQYRETVSDLREKLYHWMQETGDLGLIPEPILEDLGKERGNIESKNVKRFELKSNYPNPFNSSTTIEFFLSQSEFVKIEIFSMIGQKVETLLASHLNPGSHRYVWNAKNIASGTYYYLMSAGEFHEVKKMILLR